VATLLTSRARREALALRTQSLEPRLSPLLAGTDVAARGVHAAVARVAQDAGPTLRVIVPRVSSVGLKVVSFLHDCVRRGRLTPKHLSRVETNL